MASEVRPRFAVSAAGADYSCYCKAAKSLDDTGVHVRVAPLNLDELKSRTGISSETIQGHLPIPGGSVAVHESSKPQANDVKNVPETRNQQIKRVLED
jgi:hypothetical protein